MAGVRIVPVGPEDGARVMDLARTLLAELGAADTGIENRSDEELAAAWRRDADRHAAFLAVDAAGDAVGVATVSESFALYAGGRFGVVNELYVDPKVRSDGVGAALLDALRAYGREREWSRLELTAPAGEQWARTVRFYEREGFVFTGPQMKLRLK